MSSQDADVDVDVDVVSSPEPSPRGANTTDDEGPQNYPLRHNPRQSPPSTHAANLAASLLTTTSANLSPSTFQTLHNHSAQLLSNQFHSHLSNSLLNSASNNKENHISASDCARLSPPRTPETNNNSINSKLSPTTTTNSGYTSFSISSILSRQDSPNAKKLVAPIPAFSMNGSQDAAMISRWDNRAIRRNLISAEIYLSRRWKVMEKNAPPDKRLKYHNRKDLNALIPLQGEGLLEKFHPQRFKSLKLA